MCVSAEQLAGHALARVDELERAARRAQQARHHRLVLERGEGAGRVAEQAAHPDERRRAQCDLQLERVEAQREAGPPRGPQRRLLAQRAIAGARHVAQDAVVLLASPREGLAAVRHDDGVQPGAERAEPVRQHVRAQRLRVVRDDDATLRAVRDHLEQLRRLRAWRGADVEHTVRGLHAEKQRRHHAHHLLPHHQPTARRTQ
mmetsp:Transcript_8550/g.27188  ORF Transcript_8550/g.27188 Transcript_8550/m.27188 type:complete len:202 (-) Transcript_8550:427-1032(-)